MKRLLKILPMIGVLWSVKAFCCFAPPPEQNVPSEELIKRTANIYVAIALSAENMANDRGTVSFEVVETIKGEKKGTIELANSKLSEGLENQDEDFDSHSNQDFWKDNGGRSSSGPDCQIVPTFRSGGKYLIFIDKPYHHKSFELLKSDKDKWLTKVREEVAKEAKATKGKKASKKPKTKS